MSFKPPTPQEQRQQSTQNSQFSQQETVFDEGIVRTGIACDRIRQQLKKCIKKSDCIQVKQKKAKECYDELDLPDQCIQIMYALSECKRNMIDPRARFRGRKGDM